MPTLKTSSRIAGMVLFQVLFLSLAAAGAENKKTLQEGWEMVSAFLFNDGNQLFQSLKGGPGINERERMLGEAIALLNTQPHAEGNVNQSRENLEKLVDADPDDDAGILAEYTIGRLHQLHENPPRPEEARKVFLGLIERHAGNPVAEQAAAALVMIDLYENVSPEERSRRFEELEKIGPLLKTPSGRREYHLNMGNAYIDFSASPGRAIDHLIAAETEGIPVWQTEANTWISIGELAQAEGRNDLAVTYYEKFLKKQLHDFRNYTVQKRVEELSLPKS